MIRSDPNLAMVEKVAEALGPLREQLVFVDGWAAGLLLTDPAAALEGLIFPDESHGARQAIVKQRLNRIAESASP